MTTDREPTDTERDLIQQLVDANAIDAVTAAFVAKEIRQFPIELVDEYVNASAWLVLARGQQLAALRRIQEVGKTIAPGIAASLLMVWGAAASALAEQKVKAIVAEKAAAGAPPEDGAAPG